MKLTECIAGAIIAITLFFSGVVVMSHYGQDCQVQQTSGNDSKVFDVPEPDREYDVIDLVLAQIKGNE